MRLGSRLRFSDQNEIEETTSDADRARHDEQVRQGRITEARKVPAWTELQEVDLFERGHGLLVSATSDDVFVLHTGAAFVPHSITTIAERAPLYWFLRAADNEIVFLEKQPGGTWSERIARQEHRRARANA